MFEGQEEIWFKDEFYKGKSPWILDALVTKHLCEECSTKLSAVLGLNTTGSDRGIGGMPEYDEDLPYVFVPFDELDEELSVNTATDQITLLLETVSVEEIYFMLKTYISRLPHGEEKRILCLRMGIEIDRLTKKITFGDDIGAYGDIALQVNRSEEEVKNTLASSLKKFRIWFDLREQLKDRYSFSQGVYDTAPRIIDKKYKSVKSFKGLLSRKKKSIDPIIELLPKIGTLNNIRYANHLPDSCLALGKMDTLLLNELLPTYERACFLYEQIVAAMRDEEVIRETYDQIVVLMNSFLADVQIIKNLSDQIILVYTTVSEAEKQSVDRSYRALLSLRKNDYQKRQEMWWQLINFFRSIWK